MVCLIDGSHAAELTSIEPMNSSDGIHSFMKRFDADKEYTPSDLEVIVKQSGAAIVSKAEEVMQRADWGFHSDGSLTTNTGKYYNEYRSRLVSGYNMERREDGCR